MSARGSAKRNPERRSRVPVGLARVVDRGRHAGRREAAEQSRDGWIFGFHRVR